MDLNFHTRFSWPMVGSCEHGNKLFEFHKRRVIIDQLTLCKFMQKDPPLGDTMEVIERCR